MDKDRAVANDLIRRVNIRDGAEAFVEQWNAHWRRRLHPDDAAWLETVEAPLRTAGWSPQISH